MFTVLGECDWGDSHCPAHSAHAWDRHVHAACDDFVRNDAETINEPQPFSAGTRRLEMVRDEHNPFCTCHFFSPSFIYFR